MTCAADSVLTVLCVASAAPQSLGSCGNEWRNWFPEQLVTVAAEAPVPPVAPVTPALSPVLTAALGRGSGPAVSPSSTQRTELTHTAGTDFI